MIFCDYCSLVNQLIFCYLEFLINAVVCLWFSFSLLHMHTYINTCPCVHTYTLWLVSFVCLLEHCINLYLDVGEMHLILFYLVFVYFLFPCACDYGAMLGVQSYIQKILLVLSNMEACMYYKFCH